MGAASSRIYSSLPVPLQSLTISLYGMMLHRRRYGREHSRWLRYLGESQWFGETEISNLQLEALRAIVDHAYRTVPYYRTAYRAAGYQPGGLRSLRDFRQLPAVEKDAVREDPTAFVSEKYRIPSLYEGFTSGTSGKPVRTYKTRDAYQRNWAFQERVRSWFGIKRGTPRVTLNARPIVPPGQTEPPFWRHDWFTNNWLFSVFHMSRENLRSYVRALVQIQPHEVHGYPSAVYEMARAVLEAGETRVRPKAVITSSETLLSEQRVTIEKAFGCFVRDQYGCAENVAWISQCESGTYHVHPEYGFVEFLAEGAEVVDRPGEIVGTGFLNLGMPLIRYRMGDSGILASSAQCSCGRNFPVVRDLLGRVDDTLYSFDGRPLGRLDPLFKGLTSVVEGQFVQDEPDHLVVFLVVPDGRAEADIAILGERVRDAFGKAMRIDYRLVEQIPRSNAGKFRFQLNTMQRPISPERVTPPKLS